jgi:transposase
MNPKRTYYGYTTPQQRRLLFETWEATGSVTQACRKAKVSRGTFYYWKARFDQQGYPGLEEFESHVAHKLNYKEAAIEQKVIEMRKANPDWGKARIAHEMAKTNNWVALVSPNTVKRILQDEGLWLESGSEKKRGR